jgi:hypothetical protein
VKVLLHIWQPCCLLPKILLLCLHPYDYFIIAILRLKFKSKK